MTASFYIPTNQFPAGINELQEVIKREYMAYGIKQSSISFNKGSINTLQLFDDLIIVSQNDMINAWVSFQKMTTEIDGKVYDYLIGVSFKDNLYQATIIAYALSKYAKSLVFNDGGYLDGKEIYSPEELHRQISLINEL